MVTILIHKITMVQNTALYCVIMYLVLEILSKSVKTA